MHIEEHYYSFPVYTGINNDTTYIKCEANRSMFKVARSVAQRMFARSNDFSCQVNGMIIDMHNTKVKDVHNKHITVSVLPITNSHWHVKDNKCSFSAYTRRGEEHIVECSLNDTVGKALSYFTQRVHNPYKVVYANDQQVNINTAKVSDIRDMLITIHY